MQDTHKLIFDKAKNLVYSNYKIGKLSGVDARIIGNYKNDKNYNITADNLLKICDVLGIELKDRDLKNLTK